jgi:hypothetical protein
MSNLEYFHACNPSFNIYSQTEINYYVNLAAVRGEDVVKRMRRAIALSPNKPTYQLFSGDIGCGKSTELLRLVIELEQQGFCALYCQADKYLKINQIGLTKIWLMMLQIILEYLENNNNLVNLSHVNQAIAEFEDLMRIPLAPEASSNSIRLETILATLPDLDQEYDYLNSHTKNLLTIAIEEVTTIAVDQVKQIGKKGLVILVDNLDRLSLEQAEIIFREGGKYLRKFQCHTIYTMPILAIADQDHNFQQQFQKYGNAPIVLSKISISDRLGAINLGSLNLLRQIVLARILPNSSSAERLNLVSYVFDRPETFDQLCLASHGHITYLLSLLQACLQQQDPPILVETLDQAIASDQAMRQSTISDDDLQILQQLTIYQSNRSAKIIDLCRRLLVFEDYDSNGYWLTSPYSLPR